jgi:hypothetical protein
MHYPVNVFVGKIRDYAGSRPSAIGKIQVDGELQLGDPGSMGMSRRRRKSTAGRTARCATIRANTMPTGSEFPSRPSAFLRAGVWREPLDQGLTEQNVLSAISSLGRGADSGDAAALAVLQAQLSFCDQRYGAADAKQRENRLAVSGDCRGQVSAMRRWSWFPG